MVTHSFARDTTNLLCIIGEKDARSDFSEGMQSLGFTRCYVVVENVLQTFFVDIRESSRQDTSMRKIGANSACSFLCCWWWLNSTER